MINHLLSSNRPSNNNLSADSSVFGEPNNLITAWYWNFQNVMTYLDDPIMNQVSYQSLNIKNKTRKFLFLFLLKTLYPVYIQQVNW